MRRFFILSYDDRDDLEAVSDYELDGFDLTAFWTGDPFEDNLPQSIRVYVTEGSRSDNLGNPLSWQIVSLRLWELIEPLAKDDCQVLPIPLLYESTNAPVCGYVLLNTTRCIDCTKSLPDQDVMISNLVIETRRVPESVHMFRIMASPTIVVVSDSVASLIMGNQLVGVALLKVACE